LFNLNRRNFSGCGTLAKNTSGQKSCRTISNRTIRLKKPPAREAPGGVQETATAASFFVACMLHRGCRLSLNGYKRSRGGSLSPRRCSTATSADSVTLSNNFCAR
jgi:hypothetical protein